MYRYYFNLCNASFCRSTTTSPRLYLALGQTKVTPLGDRHS
ncbi:MULTISPECIES: hypothetical protein [unclassified Microcoleus]